MMHWPSVIKPLKLVMGQRLLPALAWDAAAGTRFRVLDRRRDGRGLIATYRSASAVLLLLAWPSGLQNVRRVHLSEVHADSKAAQRQE